MISTYTTLVLVCYLPLISATLVASYQNVRFNPFDNHSIIYNFSSIQSQQICICQCPTTTTGAISSQSSTQAVIQTSLSSTMSTMIITAVATCTTLVTFNDISSPSFVSNIIPNGYKNLNWINAQYINVTSMPSNSGFRYGVRSPPFVMHNLTSDNVTITTANGTCFSFDSLYLTSAWRDYLNFTLQTFRAGSITAGNLFSAMTSYAIYIGCSFCTGTDTITIAAQGGTPITNLIENGTQFIIDNLCISFGH